MLAFVVDANVVHVFQEERIREKPGVGCAAISAIFGAGCVALDSDETCQAEWLNCAMAKYPLNLMDWIADRMVDGKIRYWPLGDQPPFKELTAQGIPKPDHKWIKLAKSSAAVAVVTNDIDLIDCKLKKAPAKVKAKVRAAGRGPTKRYIKKKTGAEVLCCEDVENFCASIR
ncbi:hypothetical protein [Sphingopyxis panaciterrae]